ncbi:related to pisatin demethylase (cytochrome P450) [Cephalotrichum gorgonifer]|uniref:Related to pisatin demethylase (Cytochrome P450) n=1 Tax=Cephalotrichum gorgonifer TaxID=2041049 RepID=A0AAE8N5B6_9PEZI|nr:related to pisatin demethylase (cytochrome P450) [Cephalotrichum gorgonifer]
MLSFTLTPRCSLSFLGNHPSGLAALFARGAASGIAALLLSASSYAFYKWYRLSHVPGPFWTPYSLFKLLSRGRMYEDLPALDRKYGPLVRIGPNIVMYSDPETFGRVVGVRSPYTKGSFYSSVAIPPLVSNVFSVTDAEEHKALRAKLAGGYSGREHGGFEPAIDTIVATFISLIESRYISAPGASRPFDMAKRAQFFSLDVVSAVSHGRPFGFLRRDEDLHGFLADTDMYWPLLALVVCIPGLTGLFSRWPFRLAMPLVDDESGAGAVFGFVRDSVTERLGSGKRGEDMLQSFIDAGMSRYELEQELYVETLAGSDTVATAIRMTLLCLLTSPATYAKLQSELDAAAAAGAISRRAGVPAAVPPATGLMTKVVPPGGDTVQGYELPGGTELAVNIVGLMHRRDIFGEDADVFRPERWLEGGGDGARVRRMVSAVDMVFGGGRNTCPGRTIALIEINKLIPELLRRYDMAIVRPEKPMRLFHGVFWVTNDFFVRFTRRETGQGP